MTIEKEVRIKNESYRIKRRKRRKWKCVRRREINIAFVKKTKIMKVDIGSRQKRKCKE
jgi:hypothetical protein